MSGDFFVMLTTQNGGVTPLMTCTDVGTYEAELATFETEEEARKGAEGSVLGETFGFEVFERGCGC